MFNITLKNILLFLIVSCLALISCSKDNGKAIVISEACYKNLSLFADEDGDYEDWIKLKNTSSQSINLNEYYISDNDHLKKHQLPNIELAPNKDCLIFASGKDKFENYQWELIINASDQWKYNSIEDFENFDWTRTDFKDNHWKNGVGGFGFGDNDDATITTEKYGFCLRKNFEIEDPSIIKKAALHIDFDDAFIAFINGKEVARSENLGDIGDNFSDLTSPAFNREARVYQGGKPELFLLDSKLWKKHLKKGINTLAILVVNIKLKSSDLSAIPYLSIASNNADSKNLPDWWDLENASIHTNFKLSKKEKIVLSKSNGQIVDSLRLLKCDYNHSIAKVDSMIYISKNSKKNTEETKTSCYNKKPELNYESGFYDKPIWLKCKEVSPSEKVYYSLDGTNPNEQSNQLLDSLLIDSTCAIRLKTFGNNCHSSKTKNYSFFINVKHSIPVASIIAEPSDLWGDETGIYVKGKFANKSHPFEGANFYKKNEVLCNFTFFDKFQKKQIHQNIGLKIHGGGSRTRPMKSLRLTARNIYGKSKITYPFFGDTSVHERKIILLKNAGQNFNETHLTDALLHQIVESTGNVDVQNYEPCVVYINGNYWGIHNIREKIGKHYLSEHYGFPADEFNILGGSGKFVLEGSDNGFYDLTKFVLANDMSVKSNFEKFENMVNLDNLIDYFATYIYTINKDWRRINNVKFWRHEKHNDGKWQFFLVDGDQTLGKRSNSSENHIDFVWTNGFRHFKVFRKLVNENENFRNRFINRYLELMNTIFTPQSIFDKLDPMVQKLEPEMHDHFEKWNTDEYERWGMTYEGWQKYLTSLRYFIEKRPATAKKNLTEQFSKINKKE